LQLKWGTIWYRFNCDFYSDNNWHGAIGGNGAMHQCDLGRAVVQVDWEWCWGGRELERARLLQNHRVYVWPVSMAHIVFPGPIPSTFVLFPLDLLHLIQASNLQQH